MLVVVLLASILACRTAAPPQPEAPVQKTVVIPPPPPPDPVSMLEKSTIFSVYGKAFNMAPILGRLGTYENFDAMAADTKPFVQQIAKVNDGKTVVVGMHLIYGLAIPCAPKAPACLQYLEGATGDLVENYIKPAAARGWVVFLDTQLGRSTPAAQVQRMIDKGYLNYDNVHVAVDPEFHLYPDKDLPGTPVGTITAEQVNAAQELLDGVVVKNHLKTKKILMVHQFGEALIRDRIPVMIQDKGTLLHVKNVDLVIDADGLGSPAVKVTKYNAITDSQEYPPIRFRGIKVFFPNQWEKHGHFDRPPMSVEEVFGIKGVSANVRMATKPDIVIIA